jgi:NAD(P)H-dependent flavin oxidoreductase YrpB (nitropropane dioxygenase family)
MLYMHILKIHLMPSSGLIILAEPGGVFAMMQTRITKLFKIQHPILLPGMSWISQPKLVAAVSNAGGLGILASGPLSAIETAAAIKEIRRLTDKPFGIGTTLMMPVSNPGHCC